jgi:DNA helicase-2/ATP-dependent DNA helicase PcrA
MIITSKDKICIEEDFKVEAGPGAGKTEFLVNHIKNVLQNSKRMACTRKVACITYTNTAVETILKRLGKGISGKVEVSTIHSFLYKNVVKPYCSFIPSEYELCCKKINGHDDFYVNNKYIRKWFESEDLSGLKHPNTEKQLLSRPALNQALQNWILSIKCVYKNGIIKFKCDNTKAVGFDKKSNARIGINTRNLKILSDKIIGLKKIYWKKGRLDHNDILFFSYVLIDRYPFILNILRAKFPYMFVDEYQDTNPVQSYILAAIRKKETVVGVIGDKAQSIYAFQGAEPSLFDLFKVDKNNMFTIKDNHRSINQIVKFLNDIRNDICQDACCNINDNDVVIYVGDRNTAYDRACRICHEGLVESLSRDNITSNAMKKDIESSEINGKLLLEQFEAADSSSQRRNYILSFIQAIELSVNGKYKEALKSIEWIFRGEESPKKASLAALIKMLGVYNNYYNDTLMEFYDTVCLVLTARLPAFRNGAAKEFYSSNAYKNVAICINIVEDNSRHITIHKAKGSEYENVFVTDNDNIKGFLRAPDLKNNEEHRIIYVAISRARKRLFLHVNKLNDMDEKEIKKKYCYLNIQRLQKI